MDVFFTACDNGGGELDTQFVIITMSRLVLQNNTYIHKTFTYTEEYESENRPFIQAAISQTFFFTFTQKVRKSYIYTKARRNSRELTDEKEVREHY